MPAYTHENVVTFVDGDDLTEQVFGVNGPAGMCAAVEAPHMNARLFQNYVPGIKTYQIGLEFNADYAAGAFSDYMIGKSRTIGATVPLTVAPVGGTNVGDPAYLMTGLWTEYTPQTGNVGDLATSNVTFAGTDAFVEGAILLPRATRTTTASGSVFTKAGPTATQSIWATLHVFSVAGTSTPTLTVRVQSATTLGFASPTTRATFTAATATGAQLIKVGPAAITDGFWRADWTISGGTPSFGFAVGFGVF